ncbi:MAG: hypothetical protein AAGL98_07975, partial [Planctomycetota bacterium]
TGVAKAADVVNVLVLGFKAARFGVTKAIAWITKQVFKLRSHFVDAINTVLNKAADLAEKIPGVGDSIAKALRSAVTANNAIQEFGDTYAADLTAEADKLGKELQAAWVAPSYGDQMTKWFDDVQASADAAAAEIAAGAGGMGDAAAGAEGFAEAMREAERKAQSVRERIAGLQNSVDTFGFDSSAMIRFELEQLGATPEQVDQAVKLQTQLEGMETGRKAAEDMASAAEQVFEQTRTPLEKYEQRVGELSNLLNAGAVDWDVYGRAVRDAREQLERATKAADAARPDATFAGSAEALAAAYDRTRDATVTRISTTDVALASITPPAPPTPLIQQPEMSEGLRELSRDRNRDALNEARKQTRELQEIKRYSRDVAEGRAVDSGGITLNVMEV